MNNDPDRGDDPDSHESYRTENNIDLHNEKSIINGDKKDKSNLEMNSGKNVWPQQKNENEERQNIKNVYMDNPANLKLRALIEKAVKNVQGLPQYVWEPVRFNEKDIDEHLAKLEKIVMYSNKIKSDKASFEDKKIFAELVAGEIKNKIEYFNTLCAEVWQTSGARSDEDQRIIDDSFKNCHEKIKALEDKLNYYENAY